MSSIDRKDRMPSPNGSHVPGDNVVDHDAPHGTYSGVFLSSGRTDYPRAVTDDSAHPTRNYDAAKHVIKVQPLKKGEMQVR
jgi:hypothetical protein